MKKQSDLAVERFSRCQTAGQSDVWMLNYPDFAIFKKRPPWFLYDKPTMQLDEAVVLEAMRVVADDASPVVVLATSQTASLLDKVRGLKQVIIKTPPNDSMLWGLEMGFAHPFELAASPYEWIKVSCGDRGVFKNVNICFLKHERPLPHQVW